MSSLSVCITCYDGDYHLLEDLLKHFSNQTEAPDEIIISSSGLKEDDLLNKESLLINDEEVPVVQTNSEERIMQSVARNKGATAASKDLIMFFDVDDIPHPQKIEATKHIFEDASVDAFLHNYIPPGYYTWPDRKGHDWPDLPFLRVDEYPPLLKVASKNPDNTNIIIEGEHPAHQAHITLKRSIFDTVQFDEDVEMYRKEDGKFCQDVFDSGINFVYSLLKLVQYN
jgi:glycosyltransferase involved in cell wall biosynthesis